MGGGAAPLSNMNAIEIVIRRVKNIQSSIEQIAKEEIEKQAGLIERLNRSRLAKGIDAEGNATPKYVANSKAPKAPGNMKFFDTGDFYADIEAKFDNAGLTVDSSKFFLDPFRNTVELLGLAPEDIEILINAVIPKIVKRIRAL